MIYKRGKAKVIVFLLFLFTLLFLIEGNAESNTFPVGTVLGKGQAELEIIPGRMSTLGNTLHPLFSDSKLRTREGKISITLNDGSKMEAYKNSELSISGEKGSYKINLNKGSLAFNFPTISSVTIITPTVTIETGQSKSLIRKVAYTKEIDYIKGLVVIDEKGNTQIISVSGEMAVKDDRGNYQILASGKSLYISGDSYKVVPVQVPEVELPPPPPPTFYTYLPYIAGAAGAGFSGYIVYEIYKSATEKEGVASPSVP
ncbi:MAG: FecR domain-containing protein [Nitrospirae bacterium]|nr:FecR domain-containing protein [Nitrospirota bacterium]